MKKTIIVCALCVLSMSTVFAQGFGVGLKGGLNFSSIDGIEDNSSRTGFHFGAYGRVNLTKSLGIQGEALYSIQGSKATIGNVKETIDANYLNVPILLRISPLPILNFHVGPQFGILLSESEIAADTFKGSDVSLAVGAGIDLPLGLNFALRYVKGLSDISDVGGTDSFKNNTFQVSVGFDLIGLGK